MSASCGNVIQIMTRYLHFITNSQSSWNSLDCVHDQAKQELHFWKDKLRTLNGILFWPIPFVPSKILFTDASSTGCGGFIQNVVRIIQAGSMVKELQDIALNIFLFTSRRQIHLNRDLKILVYRCTGTGSVPVHVKCPCAQLI